jgi:NAD(P)-dependent dehydrogenase (short-subunit alcohol dehydrogenase family)
MGQLENKVAIVTGGAMGIGRAAALALAREGARVVVADIEAGGGAATAEAIRAAGGEAVFQPTDVGVTRDVERLVQAAVARYGRLDVLFNNVGVAIPGSVVEMDEDAWDRVINLNLTSIWRGMKFAIPEMIRGGGGSIINTNSVQALIGFLVWAGYAASKGGINALTQQAAVEYAPHKVRINAIAPGTIMTPMNERILANSDDPQRQMDLWTNLHALGRVGQPGEVAEVVVFLASEASSFITGEVLRVDGGMILKAG